MDNESLKKVKEALDLALAQKITSQEMLKKIGPTLTDALKPLLNEIALNSKTTKEEFLKALSKAKIEIPKIDIPKAQVEVKIPKIEVPTPQVTVNVPKIELPAMPEIRLPNIPDITFDASKIKVPKPEVTVNFDAEKIKIPDVVMPEQMEIKGWIGMMGYDKSFLQNPLPVQLRDANGKPISFDFPSGGGSSGRGIARIGGVDASAYASYMNADGRLKVSVESGGGGLTDTELRASHLDVQQLSGSVDSVNVISSITIDIKQLSGSVDSVVVNDVLVSIPVKQVSGAVDSVSVVAQDFTFDTKQVSGAIDSVSIASQPFALDTKQVSGSVDSVVVNDVLVSVGVNQVSGAVFSVSVTDVFGSVAANVVNPDGRIKVELPTGASGLTDTELRAAHLDIQQLSGAVDSVVVNSVLTSVEVKQVSGAVDSVVANNFPAASALADGMANPTTALVGAAPVLFNGTTWDRQRNNAEFTVLASAARTASTNSADFTNYNARGIALFLDITASPGLAETLTLNVQFKDPVSGKYRDITTFAAIVDTTGTFVYLIYPGDVLTLATTNVETQGVQLPRTWRVQVVHSAAGSWTYSVGASYSI